MSDTRIRFICTSSHTTRSLRHSLLYSQDEDVKWLRQRGSYSALVSSFILALTRLCSLAPKPKERVARSEHQFSIYYQAYPIGFLYLSSDISTIFLWSYLRYFFLFADQTVVLIRNGIITQADRHHRSACKYSIWTLHRPL